MDQVALRELDLQDLRAYRAEVNSMAARLKVLEGIERLAIAAMATLIAVAPVEAEKMLARLEIACATD